MLTYASVLSRIRDFLNIRELEILMKHFYCLAIGREIKSPKNLYDSKHNIGYWVILKLLGGLGAAGPDAVPRR